MPTTLTRRLLALSLLCTSVPALAQGADPAAAQRESGASALPAGEASAIDGPAFFRRAVAALEEAQALRFDWSTQSEGTVAKSYPSSSGTVTALRDPTASATGGWLIRVQGQSTGPDGAPLAIDIAWRSASVEWADQDSKRVFEVQGSQPTAFKGLQIARLVRLGELFSPQPFRAELAATGFEGQAPRTLEGQVCEAVMVVGVGGGTSTRRALWAINPGDGMPRQYVQYFGGMQSTLTLNLSNWQVDRNSPATLVAPADVRVAVPAGFTEQRNSADASQLVAPAPGGASAAKGGATTGAAAAPREKGGTPAHEAASPKAVARPPAPDFELTSADGTKVSLASLRGKVVVVQFWGSWCVACRDWQPRLAGAIERGAGERAGDVVRLALAVRERDDKAAAEEFTRASVAGKLLLKADAVAQAYSARSYPTTVVIGRDGTIFDQVGARADDAALERLAQSISAALAEQAPAPAPAPTPASDSK